MATNHEAARYLLKLHAEEKTIRQGKVIRTTLGDLIAAVTDEVKPFVRDPSGLYTVVSYILNDVLARHRVRAHKRSLRKYISHFLRTGTV
ncbi:MAG: hypothetical protein ND866_28090 [Pyrinomonadaceae bacterium]|nr:hypothetical protein [Pyrinomonadaceae bacterium]